MLLTNSLCLLGGLSVEAERRLWQQGIVSWKDYQREANDIFSSSQHQRILDDIPAAEAALNQGDIRYFLRRLPVAARMRVWPLLVDRAVYLDIETTGLDPTDTLTTAVLYNRGRLFAFVAGENLCRLPDAIHPNAVIVTYNGRRFDLPRLRRQFGCKFSFPHFDLAPTLRAAGYGPGLKACERQLGVQRQSTCHLKGADAVWLWQDYMRGNVSSLRTLLDYNAQDALVLERILVASCNYSMLGCPCFQPIPIPTQPDTSVMEISNFVLEGSNLSEDHYMQQ